MEIKHKITGKVLMKVKQENLCGALLCEQDLSWADLRGADLSWADLRGADLSWAEFSEAKGKFIFNYGVILEVQND